MFIVAKIMIFALCFQKKENLGLILYINGGKLTDKGALRDK